eukprot:766245-Hanusia_phi.AAC.2
MSTLTRRLTGKLRVKPQNFHLLHNESAQQPGEYLLTRALLPSEWWECWKSSASRECSVSVALTLLSGHYFHARLHRRRELAPVPIDFLFADSLEDILGLSDMAALSGALSVWYRRSSSQACMHWVISSDWMKMIQRTEKVSSSSIIWKQVAFLLELLDPYTLQMSNNPLTFTQLPTKKGRSGALRDQRRGLRTD